MSIFIDTATPEEAKIAKDFGWVKGITTNPLLLAGAGRKAESVLAQLAELNMGKLFYQLISSNSKDMHKEARMAKEIAGDQLVLKIPPVAAGFQAVYSLSKEIPCCVTALYSVSQALVAREAGAQYIAVYVNRATKLIGNGLALLNAMSKILHGSTTEILAASIKSSEEVSSSLLYGADHLTLPFNLLSTLCIHEHSEEAVRQFNSGGTGIQIEVK
ncbi:transaldolase family protein [Candidatus Kuenenia sp.]|uniref:transaldolase family protein n=1 Tax=Candidatus Kuenenia sp. TaxID=2499824 RepID=UPI00321F82FC